MTNKPFKQEREANIHSSKLPPHSIEAEQAVLGSLMIDNQRWDRVAETITERDFYSRHHQLIFA